MKASMKVAIALAAMAMLFGLAACEGDQGPQGPAGASATDTCTSACHTDDYTMEDYIVAIQTEFDESQHNTGDTYQRRGSTRSTDCSGCHTTEGYQYRIANGTTIALESSSRIGCFGCHAPHSTATFNLRQEGVVTFIEGGGTYDRGNSNTCAMCHQMRSPSPYFDSGDPIDSRYWGPHHGPQGNMVGASGAYVLPGTNYGTSATHNSIANACVGCHMATLPNDGLAGGHSFKMRYEYRGSEQVNAAGCGCHDGESDLTAFVDDSQAIFEAALSDLGDDMVTLGWLEEDKAHVNVAGAPTDADQRGAIFNYLSLLDDRSKGAHHPTYMNDVLTATQAFVTALLPQ